MGKEIHGAPGPDEGVETAAPIADPETDVASKLVLALQKMVPSAKSAGLEKSAKALTTAIGTISYEAAGYRIPMCSGCGQPMSDDHAVHRINRDRA